MNDHRDDPDRSELPGRSALGSRRIKTLVMFALLAVVVYIGGSGMKRAWRLQRRIDCSRQMRRMAEALRTYDYDVSVSGADPVAFLRDRGVELGCPARPRQGGRSSDYAVIGLLDDNGGSGAKAILYEPLSNHNGEGANVLFADGHVEFVERGRFDELIPRQR